MSPQARQTETKNIQMEPYQAKKLCTEKEISNKTQRLPSEWEKIFANNTSNKGFIAKVSKELIQLKIKIKRKTKQNKKSQPN